MDAKRFDALSRSLASPSSRRRALGFAGGGGLLLGLGRGVRAAAAPSTCQLVLTATVESGSDKKRAFSGALTLQIGDDGAIDQGALATTDGFNFTVVGQATGRLVGLRVTDANGTVVTFTGVGAEDITACHGDLAGSFTGPKSSDFGTWTAHPGTQTTTGNATGNATGSGNGTTTGNAASGSTGSTGGSTGSGSSSGSSNTGGSNSSGTSDCPSGVVCGGVCCQPRAGFTPDGGIACDGNSCSCTYTCQAAGCPNGGTDHSFTVGCDDRPNALCGENCNFPTDNGCGDMTCDNGQTLDIDSCTCVSSGGGGCVSPLTNCGDSQNLNCVDTSSDPQNCGSCGNACDSGSCTDSTCVETGGANDPCQQEAGLFTCGGQCVDLTSDDDNCGDCGVACDDNQTCVNGFCI
jgi:hypothetical protein